MNSRLAFFFIAASVVCLTASAWAKDAKEKTSHPAPQPIYAITDDDAILTNSVSFYQASTIQSGPTLTLSNTLSITGRGIGGGFFGTPRLLFDPAGQCLYASSGGTNNLSAIDVQTQQVVGTFAGLRTDLGATNGIGLAMSSNYLYAGYTQSNTIVTFAVSPGCQLSYIDSTPVSGLNGGFVGGMAVHGNLLVVAYGDGSIQSFNIANGTPASNNDEQNSTGFAKAFFPESIDITQDGHFAIFGDAATGTTVEVSDISSGQLTPTVQYNLGTTANAVTGINSASVWLSPDESLLYISNSQGGSVMAAFFNANTGKVTSGCTSGVLRNFFNPWSYVGAVVTRDTTGTGSVLYAAEFGSSIGIVEVQSNGTTCTLTESPNSPIADDASGGLLSIQVYPPRPF
jgi:6-phosphogluconolactonase (cycloisomerase 2 family)